MLVPEQRQDRAAGMERCTEALAELAETACRRPKDVGDVEAALRRYRVDLNAAWQGLAQVGFDSEWETAALEAERAVSRLHDEAREMGGKCKCLHDRAAKLRSQAAHIRQQQEEEHPAAPSKLTQN